jgi:hypothetical protein
MLELKYNIRTCTHVLVDANGKPMANIRACRTSQKYSITIFNIKDTKKVLEYLSLRKLFGVQYPIQLQDSTTL